jgi:hypothetical protein
MLSRSERKKKAFDFIEKHFDDIFKDDSYSLDKEEDSIRSYPSYNISINTDNEFYKKIITEIDHILKICKKYKFNSDNNVWKKYFNIKNDIENSKDPNQFVIDLSIRFAKQKFLPHFYSENLLFLIPLSRLEYFYKQITDQANQQGIIEHKQKFNKSSLKKQKISKWKKKEFNNIMNEKYDAHFLISKHNIKSPFLYETIINSIYDILFVCKKYRMKNTNPVLIKYRKMRRDIKNSIDKNNFCIKLSVTFAKHTFDPTYFKHKPKLINPIYFLEEGLKIVYRQYIVKNKDNLFEYQYYK